MNLDEMVAQLVAETSRVDKTDEIRRAVRYAIVQIHNTAFYDRDIQEDIIYLPNTALNFKVPLPKGYKKMRAAAPMDSNSNPVAITTYDNKYQYIDSTDLVDSYYSSKTDCYYITGDMLTIKSSIEPVNLYMQWHSTPEIQDNNLETWLMELHDRIIMDAALVRFYKSTGRNDIARDLEGSLLRMDIPMLINTYATNGEM